MMSPRVHAAAVGVAALLAVLPAAADEAPAYESVVVAAPPPAATPREDATAAASVLIPDASPRALDDLGDLLGEVPGVDVTRTGAAGAFATLSLRGSNPDQVRVYVDGVPLNVAAGGDVDLSTLPLGDVERVEVYRGSSPIAFGESALGGIVSITTRTPGASRARARLGTGSFGARFADASAGGRLGRLRLYAGLHAFDATGAFAYRAEGGTGFFLGDDLATTRANNGLGALDGVVRAAIDLPGRRELSLGLMGFAREQGLPGRINPSSEARFSTARGIAALAYESRDDLGEGSRLRAQLFAWELRDRLRDPLGQAGLVAAATRDVTRSAGATVNAGRPIGASVRLDAVVEGRRETFHPHNELDPSPTGVPAERLVGAAGLQATWLWRALALDVVPSARLELLRDVVTGRDNFAVQRPPDQPVTRVLPVLRLGLARPLAAWASAAANVGWYARVPSFVELYGNNGRLAGNPTLVPERGVVGDLGPTFRGARGATRVQAKVAGFGGLVSNLIEWTVTPVRSRPDNIGSARIWGVEGELRVDWRERFWLTAQATYLQTADLGRSGGALPLHPRLHAYVRPEARHVFARAGLAVGGFVDADVSAGAFYYPSEIAPKPARLLLGAGLQVESLRARTRVIVSARNLTSSPIADLPFFPLPGRSLFAALVFDTEHRRKDLP